MEATIKIDEKKTFQALVQFLKSLNIQVVTKPDIASKRKNKTDNKVVAKRPVKISTLRGKVKKQSAQEIEQQLKSLRDEWTRDI